MKSLQGLTNQGAVGLCAQCNRPLSSGSRFCEQCGADVTTGQRRVKRRFGWPEGLCAVLALAWFAGWVVWRQYGFQLVLLEVPHNAQLLLDGKTIHANRSSDGVVKLTVSRELHVVTVRAPGFEPWSRWVKPWALESKREVRANLYRSVECTDFVVPTGYRVHHYVAEGDLLQPVLVDREGVSHLCGPAGGKAYAVLTPVDTPFFEADRALIAEADFGSGRRKSVEIRRYKVRPEAVRGEPLSASPDTTALPHAPYE